MAIPVEIVFCGILAGWLLVKAGIDLCKEAKDWWFLWTNRKRWRL